MPLTPDERAEALSMLDGMIEVASRHILVLSKKIGASAEITRKCGPIAVQSLVFARISVGMSIYIQNLEEIGDWRDWDQHDADNALHSYRQINAKVSENLLQLLALSKDALVASEQKSAREDDLKLLTKIIDFAVRERTPPDPAVIRPDIAGSTRLWRSKAHDYCLEFGFPEFVLDVPEPDTIAAKVKLFAARTYNKAADKVSSRANASTSSVSDEEYQAAAVIVSRARRTKQMSDDQNQALKDAKHTLYLAGKSPLKGQPG